MLLVRLRLAHPLPPLDRDRFPSEPVGRQLRVMRPRPGGYRRAAVAGAPFIARFFAGRSAELSRR